MTFDGNGDLERLRAAKTPGWRHGTKKRPNPQKQVKANKVRSARRKIRKAAMQAYAKESVAAGRWKRSNA